MSYRRWNGREKIGEDRKGDKWRVTEGKGMEEKSEGRKGREMGKES